jgi:hypothetical protein
MLTRTRTMIVTLTAACSFAATSIAPAVSQAQQNDGTQHVTCPGDTPGQPGDIKTTTTTVTTAKANGAKVTVTVTSSEICGEDGQWHKMLSFETAKQSPQAPVGGLKASPAPVTATPPLPVRLTRPATSLR